MTQPSTEPPPASARQVTVAIGRLSGWLDGFGDRHGATRAELAEGSVGLRAEDGSAAWLEVPFPPLLSGGTPVGGLRDAALLAALIAHSSRPRMVGVLLVRRGGYAVGVFEGRQLVRSKVGSSYVQGTTKAGGWSQQRFARRRANQASAAFAQAADTTAAVLLPAVTGLDRLVTGGDRPAIEAVLADPRLAPLRGLPTSRLLTTPDPRLAVLKATPDQFLAVRITLDP